MLIQLAQSVCLIVLFLTVLSVTIAITIRWTLKKLLGRLWLHWYVKYASYLAVLGFVSLLLASVSSIDVMYQSLEQCGNWAPGMLHLGMPGAIDATELSRLCTLDFLVEHFFQFVVAPGALLCTIGYTLDRRASSARARS